MSTFSRNARHTNIIEVNNVHKSFGSTRAVDDLSFAVQKGDLFAFLGINGAGKSTTIGMICGTLNIDSGNIVVCEHDVSRDLTKVKQNIGVVFQDSVLDKSLSVYDNLKYRAGLYGIYDQAFIDRFEQLNKLFDLSEIKNRPLSKLSGGQKRRVDIARSIVHNPKILILDEPTTGLDPNNRQKIWNIINTLRQNHAMTIFLTTHYMEEAADANQVIILDRGRIVAEGAPIELKTKYASDSIYLYGATESDVKKLKLPYQKLKDAYKIPIASSSDATKIIIKYPDLFINYEIVKGTLDDVFLSATGYKLEEVNA